MKVRETDLPGVGKRYTIELQSRWEVTLIIHNTGRREIYIMEPEEEEPKCVLSLTEDEAKDLGFLLAGTTYQSVSPEKMEFIMKEMVMEWVKIGKNSHLVNKTLANAQIREKTGTSILAILRENDIMVNPDPHKTVIKEGDTLVVLGTREQINKFLKYCGECTH